MIKGSVAASLARFQELFFGFVDKHLSGRFSLDLGGFVNFINHRSKIMRIFWFIVSLVSSLLFFPAFFYLFIFHVTNEISFGEMIWISWLIILFITAHEVGHVALALMVGIPVRGIYFIPFVGGVAGVAKTCKVSRWHDMIFSIGGPLFGLLVPAILFFVFPESLVVIVSVSVWAFMSLFNMLPVYPMDGGRIFLDFYDKFFLKYSRLTGIVVLVVAIMAVIFCAFTWFNLLVLPWVLAIYFFTLKGGKLDKDDLSGQVMTFWQRIFGIASFSLVFGGYFFLLWKVFDF